LSGFKDNRQLPVAGTVDFLTKRRKAMADQFQLTAELRDVKGKGASRRLRRKADLVPAILYGADRDPQPLSIPHKDLHHALQNEAFFSHIITIKAEGKEQAAILKDLQRHPAKDRILHADFLRIVADQELTTSVPFHFMNEDKCVGVKQNGGVISHAMNQVEISCLPANLPEYIEIDMEQMDIGDSLSLSDVKLPEGVVIPELAMGEDHDHQVVAVNEPRRAEAADQDTAAPEAPAADADAEDDSED